MTPFTYPKTRHARSLSPGPFTQYTKYKAALRQEFGRKCVYCCAPDQGLPHTYAVEHYRPKSKFASLACDYKNLYYACSACNTRKGAYWPTPTQNKAGRYIPNPCDHVMFSHLRYSKAAVQPQSTTGTFVCALLDLNSPGAVAHRRAIEIALTSIEAQLSDAQNLKNTLDQRLAAGQISQHEYDTDCQQVATYVQELADAVSQFGC